VPPEIADQVVRMMQTVTEPGGNATQAAILGYHVAGKTGTARQAAAGGYSRRYTTTFAGLVPASNPRFATVVVINDPQSGSYFAGLVSAPVFRSVMEDALRLMDVQPDDIETWLAGPCRAEADRAPAARPRFATVVVINDPQSGSYFAGLVSAPVFRSVMEDALRLMDVQPDDIEAWLAAQARGEAKRQAAVAPLPQAIEEGFDDTVIPPAMADLGTDGGGRP